nr:hypothetical protein [Tanacetum cinerariifolium]
MVDEEDIDFNEDYLNENDPTPDSVLKALESIHASSFWGGFQGLSKLAWVKWPTVLASLDDHFLPSSLWNWSRSDLGTRNEAYFNDLINEIRRVVISSNSNACHWSIANDGVFTVGITRKHLDDHFLPSSATFDLLGQNPSSQSEHFSMAFKD